MNEDLSRTKVFSEKKVSVIVPCFNYAHFLPSTLDSILNQTYPNWECIIVDDGSTDSTRLVAEGYVKKDSRFIYIHQENKGLSAARNTGIRESKGAFVQFLDADDLIEKKKLEHQLSLFEKNPSIDILYSNMWYFDSEEIHSKTYCMGKRMEEDKPWMPTVSGKGKEIIEALIQGNIMVVNSPLIRIAAINEIGYFSEKLTSYEDWDYWMRCALNGKIFYYADEPDTYALVRMHDGSMSKNIWNMAYNSFLVRQNFQNQFRNTFFKEINAHFIKEELKDLAKLVALTLDSDRKSAKEKIEKLHLHTGWLRFKLLKWYVGFLSKSVYLKMVSLHFQSPLTTIKHQFKKIEI